MVKPNVEFFKPEWLFTHKIHKKTNLYTPKISFSQHYHTPESVKHQHQFRDTCSLLSLNTIGYAQVDQY
jgi:hypothetical protein